MEVHEEHLFLHATVWQAVRDGNLDDVKSAIANRKDLNECDDSGLSALHHACKQNHVPKISFLLQQGHLVGIKDRQGRTPLHCAVSHKEPSKDVVDLLIQRGAVVSIIDEDAHTPLHWAVSSKNHSKDVVDLLIKHGADVNAKSKAALTPLHRAVGCANPSKDVVDLLIKHGADVNANSKAALTPLHGAVGCANPSKDVVDLLIKHGADVNAKSKAAVTPLHCAVKCANPSKDVVDLLIQRGAVVSIMDENGYTPLHWAVFSKNPSNDVVDLLIKHGADVNAKNFDGDTPLHLAVRCQDPSKDVIDLLIEHGADASIKGANGYTPLHLAVTCENPSKDVVDLLIQHSDEMFLRKNVELCERILQESVRKNQHHLADFIKKIMGRSQATPDDDAVTAAYRLALEDGKKRNNRIPVMIVGQDRAGKTSLRKRLFGHKFDPDESSTVGIDVKFVELLKESSKEPWSPRQKNQKEFLASKNVAQEAVNRETGTILRKLQNPETECQETKRQSQEMRGSRYELSHSEEEVSQSDKNSQSSEMHSEEQVQDKLVNENPISTEISFKTSSHCRDNAEESSEGTKHENYADDSACVSERNKKVPVVLCESGTSYQQSAVTITDHDNGCDNTFYQHENGSSGSETENPVSESRWNEEPTANHENSLKYELEGTISNSQSYGRTPQWDDKCANVGQPMSICEKIENSSVSRKCSSKQESAATTIENEGGERVSHVESNAECQSSTTRKNEIRGKTCADTELRFRDVKHDNHSDVPASEIRRNEIPHVNAGVPSKQGSATTIIGSEYHAATSAQHKNSTTDSQNAKSETIHNEKRSGESSFQLELKSTIVDRKRYDDPPRYESSFAASKQPELSREEDGEHSADQSTNDSESEKEAFHGEGGAELQSTTREKHVHGAPSHAQVVRILDIRDSEPKQQNQPIRMIVHDLAGQSIFYDTHYLFLKSHCPYILVHDLTKPLDEKAEPRFKPNFNRAEIDLGNPLLATNLDYLLLWLNVLAQMWRHQSEKQEERKDFALPPVLIVLTNKDKFTGDVEEVKNRIKEVIRDGKFQNVFHDTIYVIDNTKDSGMDDPIIEVRSRIFELCEEILPEEELMPLTWLNYEAALTQEGFVKAEKRNYISANEAKEIAEKCNVYSFEEALIYFHRQGIFLYYKGCPYVVLNPVWLMNLFAKVITVPDKKRPVDLPMRETLRTFGILMKESVQKHPDGVLLEYMMERASLMCPLQHNGKEAFLVPSVAPFMKKGESIVGKLRESPLASLFIMFLCKFLLPGIFARLQVKLLNECRQMLQEGSEEPRLFCNYSLLPLEYENAKFNVYLVQLIEKIKIGVVPVGEVPKQSLENFARYVKKCLVDCLEAIKSEEPLFYRGLEYHFGVQCTGCVGENEEHCKRHNKEYCVHDECAHIRRLNDLDCGRETVCCNVSQTDVFYFDLTRVKPWFDAGTLAGKRPPMSDVDPGTERIKRIRQEESIVEESGPSTSGAVLAGESSNAGTAAGKHPHSPNVGPGIEPIKKRRLDVEESGPSTSGGLGKTSNAVEFYVKNLRNCTINILPALVRQRLCSKLNIIRPGYVDYRRLAALLGMGPDDINLISQKDDPTEEVFKWAETRRINTIGRWTEILQEMKRDDCVDIIDEGVLWTFSLQ